jgi:hypothetical protein
MYNLILSHPYIISSFGIGLLELIMKIYNIQGSLRWYIIHLWINLIICCNSISDIIIVLNNPFTSTQGDSSIIPIYLIIGVHIYHILTFNISKKDWRHHIVMVGIIAVLPSFFVSDKGPLRNLWTFTYCGFPGGIDYFILIIHKFGFFSKISQKKISTYINVWIRSPLGIICSFLFVSNPLNKTSIWISLLLNQLFLIIIINKK